MKDISVIICCYNSAKRIIPTLEHICKQEDIESLDVEVILVDNNSKDSTQQVAQSYFNQKKTLVEYKIIYEPQPGLSFARKKGILNAGGEFLVFCDDDNWLDKFYLRKAVDLMRNDLEIGVLGGIGRPVLESKKPVWFDKYQTIYAVGPQAKENGEVTYKQGYVYGAGSIMRKSILDNLYKSGFVHLLSGRKRNEISSGEDCEICYNIAFCGFKIVYNDKLKFQHFIPSQRLSLKYLKRFRKGQANSYDLIKSYERILFSRGTKRRHAKNRLKEYRNYINEILQVIRKKQQGILNSPDFIFSYYFYLNILKNGLLDWKRNSRQEREIYKFYQNIKDQSINRNFRK